MSKAKSLVNNSGPNIDMAGPSGYKNIKGEEVDVNSDGLHSQPLHGLMINEEGPVEGSDNSLAIIPYIGILTNKVVDKLNKLGLKRKASVSLESKK